MSHGHTHTHGTIFDIHFVENKFSQPVQPVIRCAALCQAAQLPLSGARVHRLARERGSASRMAGCMGPGVHSNKPNQRHRAQPTPDPNRISPNQVYSCRPHDSGPGPRLRLCISYLLRRTPGSIRDIILYDNKKIIYIYIIQKKNKLYTRAFEMPSISSVST